MTRVWSRRTAVLTCLVLGVAALLLTTATWVRSATSSAVAAEVPLAVSGTVAAPPAAAGALVVVAGALATALAGRWGARVAGVVVALGGALVVVAALGVVTEPLGPARAAALEAVGVAVVAGPTSATPLAWLTVAAGLGASLAGMATVASAGRWSAAGRRHVASGRAPGASSQPAGDRPPVRWTSRDPQQAAGGHDTPAADHQDAWDALSRGEDPT